MIYISKHLSHAKANEKGQSFGEQIGVEEALMVDLLRRTGQFEEALITCNEGLKKRLEKLIVGILEFQKLLSKSDIACHLVSEATRD